MPRSARKFLPEPDLSHVAGTLGINYFSKAFRHQSSDKLRPMTRILALLMLMVCGVSIYSGAQTAATNAVLLPDVTMWNNNSPTTYNHCLNSVPAQSPFSGGGAMTDVAWFRFTVPATLSSQPVVTSSVRIQVVPTGFDALVEYFSGTAAAPVFRQFINGSGSGIQEILRTDWTINAIVPGTEYFVRVSSVTDIPSGCFTIGVQYYPGVYVRNGWHPYPNGQMPLVGYDYNEFVRRNVDSFQGVNFNANVQGTRFRLVDSTLPSGSPGCTLEVNGVVSTAALTSFPCVCYGITFNVFIQVRMDGVWTGESLVRQLIMRPYAQAAPTISTLPAGACTTISNTGFIQCSFVTSSTLFEWEFCTAGLPCFTVMGPAPGNTQLFLSQATCLKFGRTYNVRVRAQVCSQWTAWSVARCLTVPQIPFAVIVNCPANTIGNSTVLISNFLNNINQYTWLFTPIQAGSPMLPIGPAILVTTPNNTIPVNQSIPNGVYRVQVKPRTTTCNFTQEGEYGPWCIIYKNVSYQGQGMILEEEPDPGRLEANVLKTELEYFDYVANKPIDVITLAGRNGDEWVFSVLTGGKDGSGMLGIMNASGQLITEQEVRYTAEDPRVGIILPPDFGAGIYFITFRGDQGDGAIRVFLE